MKLFSELEDLLIKTKTVVLTLHPLAIMVLTADNFHFKAVISIRAKKKIPLPIIGSTLNFFRKTIQV
jgi:hypothetical protein